MDLADGAAGEDSRREGRTDARPTVTVLIPSYRRPAALMRCLDGLLAGSRLPEQIVVVLRDTDEESHEALTRRLDDLPPEAAGRIEWAEVGEPGPMAAANAGLAMATGEIVCLTDDDCIPTAEWLARLVALYADHEVVGAGGRDRVHTDGEIVAEPSAVVGRITWYGRIIGNHHQPGFRDARTVDHLKGANMSFRRHLIPVYDLNLRSGVHHEVDICLGVLRHGGRIVYDPLALVDHYPAPRHYGHPRDSESMAAIVDLSHDYAYVMLKHLTGPRRAAFIVFALLIGQHWRYGLLRMIARLPFEGGLAVKRWQAAMAGLRAGMRTARLAAAERARQ